MKDKQAKFRKKLNSDVATDEQIQNTDLELVEFMNSINEPIAAERVLNMMNRSNKTVTKNAPRNNNAKLLDVNREILATLKKINADMIDEQDTSIKSIGDSNTGRNGSYEDFLELLRSSGKLGLQSGMLNGGSNNPFPFLDIDPDDGPIHRENVGADLFIPYLHGVFKKGVNKFSKFVNWYDNKTNPKTNTKTPPKTPPKPDPISKANSKGGARGTGGGHGSKKDLLNNKKNRKITTATKPNTAPTKPGSKLPGYLIKFLKFLNNKTVMWGLRKLLKYLAFIPHPAVRIVVWLINTGLILYDAHSGWTSASDMLNVKEEDLTTFQRILSATSAVLGGFSMGAINDAEFAQDVDKGIGRFGIINKFEKAGIIDHDYYGNSMILDWDKLNALTATEVKQIRDLNDWSNEDTLRLDALYANKGGSTDGKYMYGDDLLSKSSNEYKSAMADLETARKEGVSMTPALKYNNPGNLMTSSSLSYEGIIGYQPSSAGGSFAVFDTFEHGYKALRMELNKDEWQNLPLGEVMLKYAPYGHGGNDPAKYAAMLAQNLGTAFKPGKELGQYTQAEKRKISALIFKYEAGASPMTTKLFNVIMNGSGEPSTNKQFISKEETGVLNYINDTSAAKKNVGRGTAINVQPTKINKQNGNLQQNVTVAKQKLVSANNANGLFNQNTFLQNNKTTTTNILNQPAPTTNAGSPRGLFTK